MQCPSKCCAYLDANHLINKQYVTLNRQFTLQVMYLFSISVCCSFLTDVSAKNTQAFQPHFVENPINAYHFVKRMADWNNVIANIQCDECILTQAVKSKS